jgi:5-hydroxyisourate hydrolase
MSAITTHVLDTARGRPAEGVPVTLSRQTEDGGWEVLGNGQTNRDGRLTDLLSADAPLIEGTYQLTFGIDSYFAVQGLECFYPRVSVAFRVTDAGAHYHVPLLLSPFGYSTYRGS